MLTGFQNCGETSLSGKSKNLQGEQVVSPASQYKKITYGPLVEILFDSDTKTIEVDLSSGSLDVQSAMDGSAIGSCQLEAHDLAAVKNLLDSSQVCLPAPPPGCENGCMGWTSGDILLSNGNQQVLLGSSHVLCNGLTDRLRDILDGIRANPPVSCLSN